MKIYMFRAVPLPIIRCIFTVKSALLYVIYVRRQLSRRTRMELSSILVLLESCLSYTSADCTVNKLLMMGRGIPETFRVSCRSNFFKFVHPIGFIIKKLIAGQLPCLLHAMCLNQFLTLGGAPPPRHWYVRANRKTQITRIVESLS